MKKRFTRFAAIDWSGAKGSRHKGIAVAVADAGDAPPRLVRPGHVWSRTEVLDWLAALADGPPTLAGMDFSFAPPFVARGAYLPGDTAPTDARAFWAFVDAACDDEDLGAASFLERSYRRHFYFGKADGTKADYMHLRACEAAFNASGGGKPSTVFDAIGAAQVAKGSFAGMRLLHHLGERLPVWPFDPVGAGSLLVEIYCRAFIRLAGGRGLKLRSLADLNAALARLGSRPVETDRWLNDNETDVLVTAVGLRTIADDPAAWAPAGLDAAVARTEGWTFGVR
nr:B299 [uncultured bacterium]